MAPLLRNLAAALLTLTAAGCATAPNGPGADQNDPYETQNRKMFELNQSLDRNFMLPVAKGYVAVVPDPARDGIHNFLVNLNLPVTFANDVLQGEVSRAGETVGRFTVNSTVGIGGLIDVAEKIGIPEHKSDFGETLAVYGVGEGPYLVLPLLGPSNPRDATGYAVDVALNPWTWISWRSSIFFKLGEDSLQIVDERSRNIETLDELERSSVDLYATLRSLYRQHRQAEINHGKANIENLPNF
ncbi:MAG TPA: VacJ family lipoprotein [Rhizomicrobium sp.]|nr:VacJ family lipoprotein [Rhizomicrobium sp.]